MRRREGEKGDRCVLLDVISIQANRATEAEPLSPESRTPALSQNQPGTSHHLPEPQFPHLPNGGNTISSMDHSED